MKKKLIAAVSITAALLGTTAFADADWYDSQQSDPFNNDLFEVVSEIKFSDEIKENYPRVTQTFLGFGGFDGFEINTNQFTANMVQEPVNIKIDYDGNAYVTGHEQKEYNEEEYITKEGVVKDGLAAYNVYYDSGDPNYGGIPYVSYKDINGNELAELCTWYCVNKYNCGLINLVRDMNSGVLSGDTITYILNPWENKEYYFKGSIYEFNDYGYAIYNPNNEMECTVNDKYYIVKLKKGIIPSVFYNNEKISFDQLPVIENNRTLVPIRAIFEKIGAEVAWDPNTQTATATKDDTTITLTINSTTATKNGKNITLDVAPKIVNGRTLVPLRFVSDCFNVDVNWDGDMKMASLTSK